MKRRTPILFASISSTATATADLSATPTASTANTITLSTYIFVLLTILSCMVGAVFSFICCKLVGAERKA